MKKATCISVLGTASDVGKSVVVTALCRIFRDMGISVAPFKAQNMSNNSYVVKGHNGEWGEIGRAQVVQAEAAGVLPHVDMNPVLLKPVSNVGAQVVVLGKAVGESSAVAYGQRTGDLKQISIDALERLRDKYEMVVMEGAGSCAEVNLKPRDFVNFAMVTAANARVILVADIDRGGVFAQIIGTLELLSVEERKHVVGVIINRFRGDASLFRDGVDFIEQRTGLPVLGIIPYIHDIGVDSEDAVVLDSFEADNCGKSSVVSIAVIHLPHISNFTDFAPLEKHRDIRVTYVRRNQTLSKYDVVILPGTKNVCGDLQWLKQVGLSDKIKTYAQDGGHLVGICGGYQILGDRVEDPHGVEGHEKEVAGLGLLNVVTVLAEEKQLRLQKGTWLPDGTPVWGYEIHHGQTAATGEVNHAIQFEDSGQTDGVISANGHIFGTYLHGIFDSQIFLDTYIAKVRPDLFSLPQPVSTSFDTLGDTLGISATHTAAYDNLARVVGENVDIRLLLELVNRTTGSCAT